MSFLVCVCDSIPVVSLTIQSITIQYYRNIRLRSEKALLCPSADYGCFFALPDCDMREIINVSSTFYEL